MRRPPIIGDEVRRQRLPGWPERGIPVPGPGRGVRRDTPGHFFQLFVLIPLFLGPLKINLVQLPKNGSKHMTDRFGPCFYLHRPKNAATENA